MGDHNARFHRWFEFLTTFDYTLEYRQDNADVPSHLPEPGTEHARRGSASLTPVGDGDGGIYLNWTCGLRTRSPPTPGISLGGLVPRPDSAVLSGLPFASFRFFFAFCGRTDHVCMRVDDLLCSFGEIRRSCFCLHLHPRRSPSRPWGKFDHRRHSFRFVFFFVPVPFEGGTGSAEAPQLPRPLSPSMLPPQRARRHMLR